MINVIIGLVAGNIFTGFLFGDWAVTVTMLVGQISAIAPLWLFGYLRERD